MYRYIAFSREIVNYNFQTLFVYFCSDKKLFSYRVCEFSLFDNFYAMVFAKGRGKFGVHNFYIDFKDYDYSNLIY